MRQRALNPENKAHRVYNFHRNTLQATAEMVGAAGLSHPNQLRSHHIVRRVSANEVRLVSNLIPFLKPGELLAEGSDHPIYRTFWNMADPNSFEARRITA